MWAIWAPYKYCDVASIKIFPRASKSVGSPMFQFQSLVVEFFAHVSSPIWWDSHCITLLNWCGGKNNLVHRNSHFPLSSWKGPIDCEVIQLKCHLMVTLVSNSSATEAVRIDTHARFNQNLFNEQGSSLALLALLILMCGICSRPCIRSSCPAKTYLDNWHFYHLKMSKICLV